MIKLGIIEDNKQVTESLLNYFENDALIKIGSHAEYVEQFIKKTPEGVDVILLDLNLPFKNGMDSIRDLSNQYPNVSIIIYSVSADYDTLFKCLCNGAHSYLLKGEPLDKIKETIITTFEGGSNMSVQIARKVVEYFKQNNESQIKTEETKLNDRENEVVNEIIKGNSYKMVAQNLGISINTVRSHIKSIYRKLNINSNIELANIYHKKKLF
ncbi:MAG: response regulator transcription factor [Chitinophagaceae bacterium]|nr:response regulator transcription factor [Chitinophagaceae bacterium]